MGNCALTEWRFYVGLALKRDEYLAALETVTAQARTLWDCEKMRDALATAKHNNERKCEALKREQFAQRLNGDKVVTK